MGLHVGAYGSSVAQSSPVRFGNFLAGIATAIAIGIAGVPSSPGSNLTLLQFSKNREAACSAANVWVNTTAGGSPTRNGSPAAYNSATAYGGINAGLAAAQAGDTVGVQSGTYVPGANLTITASFTSQVRVCAATPLGVVLGTSTAGDTSGVGAVVTGGSGDASHITLDGFTIPGGVDGTADASLITGFHLTNDAICVGVWLEGQCINFHNTNDLEITGDVIGPGCCGNSPSGGTAHNSPELLRLGIPGPSGGQAFTATVVTNDVFQGALRECTLWPSTYVLNGSSVSAGSCPDVTCTNFATCHVDQIHIWGLQSSTISNSWFWNSDCQAISLSGSNGSTNSNDNIFGNIIDNPAESCGGVSIGYQDCGSGAPGDAFAGTFNTAFNSMTGRISYDTNTASTCDAAGTVWNTIGNVGAYYNADVGCGAGSGTTVVNQYNYWSTTGGVNSCSGTGNTLVASDPSAFSFFKNTTQGSVSFDLHLNTSGISGVSGNVPGGFCGSPYTPDLDGNARPSPCDAGADQG